VFVQSNYDYFDQGRRLFDKFRGETGVRQQGAGGRRAGEASDLDKAFLLLSRCCNEQTVNGKCIK